MGSEAATPVHRPQRPAGSTHSSTRGLRPPVQEAAQLFGIVPRPRARCLNEDVEGAFWKSRGRVNRGRRCISD